jgi:chemotaxis response regulator CheB
MQKIIVANHNRLLREMIARVINADENLKIVKILDSLENLYEHVQRHNIDWVIVSFTDGKNNLPSSVKEIMMRYPDIGVLVVSPDGSNVRVKWFETKESVLNGIGLDELIKLLSNEAVHKNLERKASYKKAK